MNTTQLRRTLRQTQVPALAEALRGAVAFWPIVGKAQRSTPQERIRAAARAASVGGAL
jgi:hypothetical protein